MFFKESKKTHTGLGHRSDTLVKMLDVVKKKSYN